MVVKILQAKWLSLDLQVPEEPAATRKWADASSLLIADARGGEGLDVPLFIENAECGVLRVGHEPCLIGDALEHLISIELGCERKARGVHRLQLLPLLLQSVGESTELLGVRSVAQLQRAELVEHRGRERENAGHADDQRDEVGEADREQPVDEDVIQADEGCDEQRGQDDRGDTQAPRVTRAS